MQIGSEEWIETLIRGGEQLGHPPGEAQARQMAMHAHLLVEWNRRVNLTAITDPVQVAVKHCLDAIVPLHLLPQAGALLDIGTGGGFPGIPLKIMRPDLDVTLVDSVRKKISFVNHVIRELGLTRTEALHARAQDLAGREGYRAHFQVVACRALTDLGRALRLALPLLAPRGRFVAYQGPKDPSFEDITESEIRMSFSPLEQMTCKLPIIGDRRKIVVVQKRPV